MMKMPLIPTTIKAFITSFIKVYCHKTIPHVIVTKNIALFLYFYLSDWSALAVLEGGILVAVVDPFLW